MTFVTTLSFQSGDRAALDDVVSDLKDRIERKGAECKGPHQEQPEHLSVPRYARCQPGEQLTPWSYTVYTRWLEIHGSDQAARQAAEVDLPDSVHVEVDVEQRTSQAYR